ncbi:LysM peptidoglycan-binding domain-containing protein [Paenisporosarcina antarctica]|uniref:LysM domain-containing protein n=1 Tax=Paenisporosarcina antarctica TaxID=417367 RepID=A0A4P6ZXK8_9BACL|nr:LysM domain-containing protein [Paenisporosarcina antarctica]QBP41360.1 LysM domain-containing protein [Paenisporosarcina antarctica]
MNKNDYQNKIDEHRKPIQINDEEKPNTRTSRRSNNVAPKKTKQKTNLMLPILFFFFILIPVSILIYVFAFYEPNSNETTVLENSQFKFEQNKEDTESDSTSENKDTQNQEETTEPKEEEPVVEDTSKVAEPKEEKLSEEQPKEDTPAVEQPKEETPQIAKTHVVQPGETLYRIAMNYYNSADAVEKIKSANGLTSNSISTGQALVLP